MWDLPGLGLEPASPALAGGFLTTAPPGKPGTTKFNSSFNPSQNNEVRDDPERDPENEV